MSSVAIFLHSQHYVAGGVLSGDVVVTVSQQLQAHHVTLFFDGHSKVHWQETEVKREDDGSVKHVVVERKDKQHFLKEKIVLSGPVTLQPGQNTFRFTYNIPPGLPASYSEKSSPHGHKLKALVDYDLEVEVDVHHGKNLKNCVHLALGQLTAGPISPVEHRNSKSFMFNQGNLAMRVELDRDVYFPGEEIKMKLEVTNESVKKVTGINVQLLRHITLHSHHHHRFNHTDIAMSQRLEGLDEATKDSRFSKFRLPCEFERLTTKGELVQVSHELKVECDVPMAVDLSIKVPIVLTVPQHLDLRAKQYSAPQDVEHETIVQQGDSYHERTPLILPSGTGECACCVLF
jgi:hypothetical protein